MGFPDQFIDVR